VFAQKQGINSRYPCSSSPVSQPETDVAAFIINERQGRCGGGARAAAVTFYLLLQSTSFRNEVALLQFA